MSRKKRTRADEIRVFMPQEVTKLIDGDIPRRGKSRSDVVRGICQDYYIGNLVNARDLLVREAPEGEPKLMIHSVAPENTSEAPSR